jgi:hypothetical protein
MFSSKKSKLFDAPSKATSTSGTSQSAFVTGAMKSAAVTSSQNGAVKFKSTGNDFVDQFGKLGTYKKPRTFGEISKDAQLLYSQNKTMAVAFSLYIRMITRVTDIFGKKTSVAQKGAELKHEGIMRMIWLATNDKKVFEKNITLFIAVGSWKDIITMLQYDLVYNGWNGKVLDWKFLGQLILTGLNDATQSELLKKYLPQIKSRSACKTVEAQADNMISKWICNLLFGNKSESENYRTYKSYRQLKSSGTAHQWQQLISQGKHNLIDFDKIHGRALNLLVRSKYLQNQGLSDKFSKWIEKPTTEAKFTGFVHELFEKLPASLSGLNKNEQTTINKQFETLVEKSRQGEKPMTTSFIVVRDTSGSMNSTAAGTKLSCFNVGKALALFFSSFLTGKFADAWIEFDNNAEMRQWKGAAALDKWYNETTSRPVGGTNFESVLDLFVKLKKQGIDESEFPTGILCISDGEFNPSRSLSSTNVKSALQILRRGGFSETYISNFVIVLWNVSHSYGTGGQKFETYGDTPNVFYFSGYSAATVSFLTNEIKTAAELFEAAMNQEILSLVQA